MYFSFFPSLPSHLSPSLTSVPRLIHRIPSKMLTVKRYLERASREREKERMRNREREREKERERERERESKREK